MISFLTRKSEEDCNYHFKCKHFFMFYYCFLLGKSLQMLLEDQEELRDDLLLSMSAEMKEKD